jgi:peroxiredoxin (alkyl hydroperoxide reductase subunit C)
MTTAATAGLAPVAERPLLAGTRAPEFVLPDAVHSRVALTDFRGQPLVVVFHVADWHPTASEQLARVQRVLPDLRGLDAQVVAVSTDTTWSHVAFAKALDLDFPLLADDTPPGATAAAFGVATTDRRSRRSLFVIDGDGVVRWSVVVPEAIDPGVDGVLRALEALRDAGV